MKIADVLAEGDVISFPNAEIKPPQDITHNHAFLWSVIAAGSGNTLKAAIPLYVAEEMALDYSDSVGKPAIIRAGHGPRGDRTWFQRKTINTPEGWTFGRWETTAGRFTGR